MINFKKINDSGITLIALVITIIVILVLSGIVLNMAAGNNGILKMALKAIKRTDEASIQENNVLEQMNTLSSEGRYSTDSNSTNNTTETGNNEDQEENSIAHHIQTGAVLNNNENIILTDNDGYSITIPKGFRFATDSAASVVDGIVVEDANNNQYVWIPVFSKEKVGNWGVEYPNTLPSKKHINKRF